MIKGGSTERNTAILDLLYLFQAEPRSKNSLKQLLGLKTSWNTLAGRKSSIAKDYNELTAILMDERVYPKLVDFILEQYSPDVAVELIELVVEEFASFRDWLVEQGAQTGLLGILFAPERESGRETPAEKESLVLLGTASRPSGDQPVTSATPGR